jgi:hypothetical protein
MAAGYNPATILNNDYKNYLANPDQAKQRISYMPESES